jgi:hypothetical protein
MSLRRLVSASCECVALVVDVRALPPFEVGIGRTPPEGEPPVEGPDGVLPPDGVPFDVAAGAWAGESAGPTAVGGRTLGAAPTDDGEAAGLLGLPFDVGDDLDVGPVGPPPDDGEATGLFGPPLTVGEALDVGVLMLVG